MASKFVGKNLARFQDRVREEIKENGIVNALLDMREQIGFDGFGNTELVDRLSEEFEVPKEEAAYAARQIAAACMEQIEAEGANAQNSASILASMRDTDITYELKGEMCKITMQEAVQSGDEKMLEVAGIVSDGMSIAEYQVMKESVAETFGQEAAERLDMVIKAKESPERVIHEIRSGLESGGEGSLAALHYAATAASALADHYYDQMPIDVAVKFPDSEDEPPFFEILSDGRIPDELSELEITDKEKELSIKKEDAIHTIQKFQIRGNAALDCICETNLPPTNPNFTSELAQKFANYVSSSHVPAGNTEKEKHMLSSIVPDDQRAAFERMADDCMKDYQNEIHKDSAILDMDHDGVSDIHADIYGDEFMDQYEEEHVFNNDYEEMANQEEPEDEPEEEFELE